MALRSSYLAPALQTWRLSTFLWFSGDRGTGLTLTARDKPAGCVGRKPPTLTSCFNGLNHCLAKDFTLQNHVNNMFNVFEG